jgi:hypothetical protein
LRRKKTGSEIAEICGGFGQIPSFLLLKLVYEEHANPNPLTPKEDNPNRTDKHLKYYIYKCNLEEHVMCTWNWTQFLNHAKLHQH